MIPAFTLKTSSTTPNAAVRFMSGYNLDQYLAGEKTRAAVERMLEICGEAMNNLRKIAPDIADNIPHSRAIIPAGFFAKYCWCSPQGTGIRRGDHGATSAPLANR